MTDEEYDRFQHDMFRSILCNRQSLRNMRWEKQIRKLKSKALRQAQRLIEAHERSKSGENRDE